MRRLVTEEVDLPLISIDWGGRHGWWGGDERELVRGVDRSHWVFYYWRNNFIYLSYTFKIIVEEPAYL
jgi:hypothetical protein